MFGYVYDERMLEHACPYDPTMAERPERMKLIYERLIGDSLLSDALQIEAREASDEELLLNHPKDLLDQIEKLKTDEECEDFCRLVSEFHFHSLWEKHYRNKEILWMSPKSYEAARVAAGGTIELVKACVDGKIGNGFAIVRPPGHHSYGSLPQGYCIFNNVAIAAKFAVEKLGIKKVAVVDFDFHPGNGTYYSLKDDPRFHFTSFHAYHHGAFWPFNREFDFSTGRLTNQLFVPLNATMNSEGDYVSVFHHVVLPVLRQFVPELILISAGFDAGYYDIMVQFGQAVKAHGFGHMAKLLADLCPNRTIAVLEGGYFSGNYTESAAMMVRGLQGKRLPRLHYPERVSGALCKTTWNLLHHHSSHYPELKSMLHKLEKQQENLGLAPFSHTQEFFFGEKIRKLYDTVMEGRSVKTREWFPELNDQQRNLCQSKIDEYVQKYDYDDEKFDEGFLLRQLVWDENTKCDAFLKSAPMCLYLVNEFNDFVEGRIQTMIICDRDLYREGMEQGKCEKLDRIDFCPVSN